LTSRRNDLVLLLSSILSLLYGLYLMYIVITPLYTLKGVFNGKIAISWYELELNGNKVHLSTLDTIRILGFPLYTLGFFSLIIGIAGIYI
jgi:hypothetical protein